jgi:bisphosphoglycerate-independent phosphoglycerate mutase (AlkP superfamily)
MLLADRDAAAVTLDATLIDVAPTILAWLDLPAPAYMTGRVLFPRAAALA